MAGGHLRRAALLAALACGVLAGPAHALTPTQARAIALRALKPQSAAGRVVVFGLPKPLPAGVSVFEGGLRTHPRSGQETIVATRLARPAWLYWEDLAYGARFQHPSRMLLVDDRTGKVILRRNLLWYPVVDGTAPAFVAAGKASAPYRVFSNVPGAPAARRTSGVAARAADALPADAFKNDCLIMIGRTKDPSFAQDFAGIQAAAERYGIPAFTVNSGLAHSDPDGRDLADAVAELVKAPHDCKDVMLYIDGHGYKTGPTGVNVGTQWVRAGSTPRGKPRWKAYSADVTADDLAQIMRDHPKTTFKLVVDACFSGRFILDLPRSDHPNLLVLDTAARADEYSYSYVDSVKRKDGTVVRNTTDNPGNTDPKGQGRGEFTNGFLAGLDAFASSRAEVANARAQGGSLLAHMIERAFTLGLKQDFAASQGLMKPLISSPSSPGQLPGANAGGAPTVDPIEAVFVQAQFGTRYEAHATDPGGKTLTYRWTLDPPRNDPGCNNQGNTTGTGPSFMWFHGDQHGCNHTKEGPNGHEGIVHVVVSNGTWSCRASYAGTNSGVGAEKPVCSKP